MRLFILVILMAYAQCVTAAETTPSGSVDSCKLVKSKLRCKGRLVLNKNTGVETLEVRVSGEAISLRRGPNLLMVGASSDGYAWIYAWSIKGKVKGETIDEALPVVVRVSFNNATTLELTASVTPSPTSANDRELQQIYLLGILLLIITIVGGLVYSSRISLLIEKRVGRKYSSRSVAIAVLLLGFLTLVGLGITGSSMANNFGKSSELGVTGLQRVAGSSQGIRSDEWMVATPMAIGQFNHVPAFPIINDNLGLDGQNMLIVGMAGVPVAHITALAKPTTWGYFLFDLRRALAWYWWFPVFACLFALWATLEILLPQRWRFNLAMAALFVTSSYIVAWSNWPAYAVFFPALAFVLFNKILSSSSWFQTMLLGALLGLTVAGFFLILYPPWQISLAYLFIFLSIGVIVQKRLWKGIGLPQVLALAVSGLVATLLFGAWWSDAKDAIAAIQATIYPGQRDTLTGGGMTSWNFFRGFLNARTLFYHNSTVTNPCESASFLYMFPIVFFIVGARWYRRETVSWEVIMLLVFCLCVVFYHFIGVPALVAKWSLLGRIPESRADLALGLASWLLVGLSLGFRWSKSESTLKKNWRLALIAVGYAIVVLWATTNTPIEFIGKPKAVFWVLITCYVIVLAYFLLINRARAFIYANILLVIGVTLRFNPLVLAPTAVTPGAIFLKMVSPVNNRVLVIGSRSGAMNLLAAGVPVVNGVFYYPQPTLWQRLDPLAKNLSVTNRYQGNPPWN